MKRREFAVSTAAVAASLATPLSALAQGKKDSIVMAMALEPPVLTGDGLLCHVVPGLGAWLR